MGTLKVNTHKSYEVSFTPTEVQVLKGWWSRLAATEDIHQNPLLPLVEEVIKDKSNE